jgi:hypothetical protein
VDPEAGTIVWPGGADGSGTTMLRRGHTPGVVPSAQDEQPVGLASGCRTSWPRGVSAPVDDRVVEVPLRAPDGRGQIGRQDGHRPRHGVGIADQPLGAAGHQSCRPAPGPSANISVRYSTACLVTTALSSSSSNRRSERARSSVPTATRSRSDGPSRRVVRMGWDAAGAAALRAREGFGDHEIGTMGGDALVEAGGHRLLRARWRGRGRVVRRAPRALDLDEVLVGDIWRRASVVAVALVLVQGEGPVPPIHDLGFYAGTSRNAAVQALEARRGRRAPAGTRPRPTGPRVGAPPLRPGSRPPWSGDDDDPPPGQARHGPSSPSGSTSTPSVRW